MNHLSYYQYQAKARGIHSIEDVKRVCANHRHFYDQIVRPWLPVDPSCRIAEIACGHGSFLHWLASCGYRNVIGIDSSSEQTELASLVCGEVLTMDAIEWLQSQPDSCLDVISGIDFAEHISKDDFMEVLHHAGRTLKPGGRIILRLPNGDSPFVGMNLFNDITHVWTYTPNCLATLGRMHGLLESRFEDEGIAAIRDHRWLKVPLGLMIRSVATILTLSMAKVRVRWWSPHLWACLIKA
jgi:2-polyprenyl-3-methyl-5-hydroxy-6-metoxy-1,4-benzoquinol methylase